VSGVTDLFVYDLGAREVRRLTSDPWAALAPSWSPDGRMLAFATDRFTTDLETLRVGTFEIAAIDVERGEVRRLAGFEGASSRNPQYAQDGSLFFIANRDGIPNVYRLPASAASRGRSRTCRAA
jgi:Tol biopolymer transport system component